VGPAVDSRERIVDAAAKVLSARGVDGVRYVDVADAAGVSVGAVQHYFRTLRELIAEAFRSFNQAWLREGMALLDGQSDPAARLSALLSLCTEPPEGWSFQGSWSVWLEFWSSSLHDPELWGRNRGVSRTWRRAFTDVIEDGMASGRFAPAPADDVVDRLIAQADGLAIRGLLEPSRMPPKRIRRLLLVAAEREVGVPLPAEPHPVAKQ